MLVSIFVAIGQQNLGDELILKNEIKLLEEEYGKNTKFIVFTYDKQNPFFTAKNVTYKEYFPISIREGRNFFRNINNFFTFLRVIIKSDLIVLGGGGIIYDEEKQANKSPLDLWLMRVRFFNFFRKHYIFFRGGVDVKNPENLQKVRHIFEKAYKVEVRDENSYNILQKLGIRVSMKPDPVFYDNSYDIVNFEEEEILQGIIPSFDFNKDSLKNFKLKLKGKTVGLALRGGYFVERTKLSARLEEGIVNEVINYLLEQEAKIILLPHSFHETDDVANDFLFLTKFIGQDGVLIKASLQEVYDTYRNKEIDFCFAERLHSIILCQVYGIPFVGVSYSKKTEEILRKLKV